MEKKGFKEEHRGSNFDEFLEEEKLLDHCKDVAAERVRTFQSKPSLCTKKKTG